jgi:hypothetical protein
MNDTVKPTVSADDFQARDLNTELGPRTHTFAGFGPDSTDLDISFEKGRKWRAVPRAIGMKLAAIEGFEVRDSDGRAFVIRTETKQKTATVHLAPDEVIARLDELTMQALARRVQETTKFAPPKDAKREDMIAVLLRATDQQPADERDLNAAKVAA